LTELKKNGVLGKDVVLRKTMLDECKGEKFEEVISTMAVVVLRKACRSRYPELDLERLEHIPKDHLVPLILAYKHSLQQSLQQRKLVWQRSQENSEKLESAQIDLGKRLEETQKDIQPVDEQDLTRLSDMVRSVWIGDDRWCDVLLEGCTHSTSALLQKSFQSSLTESIDDGLTTASKHGDLTAELDARIREQQRRLKQWKTCHASMKAAQRDTLQSSKIPETACNPPSLRLDRHKNIRFDSLQTRTPAEECLEPYHASVLRNMREELVELESGNSDSMNLPAEQVRDQTVTSRQEIGDSTGNAAAYRKEAVPEDLWKNSSSTQENTPTGTASRHESTPHINMTEEMQVEDLKGLAGADVAEAVMSTEYKGSSQILQLMDVPSSSPPVNHTIELAKFEEEDADAMAQSKRGSVSTLHERTRASLLPFTTHLSTASAHDESSAEDESDASQLLPPLPKITAPRGTLLERTRQSMSLLPNPPSNPKAYRRSSAKPPRFSEVFPVNQYETPGKAQTRQSGSWSPSSGASTPRDKLFSEEADYASVFKSRPRIAVSPSLSPERSNLGLDSMLADRVDELQLEDSEGSPSRGFMRNR
jgi:hypothetical protein